MTMEMSMIRIRIRIRIGRTVMTRWRNERSKRRKN
jgi:hypothetical protein